MTLRLIRSTPVQNGFLETFAISQIEPDGWLTRAIKLLPGEAMLIFGLGSTLLSATGAAPLAPTLVLAGVAIAVTALLRYHATKNRLDGAVQWAAIFISVVSTILWIFTLELPKRMGENLIIYPGLLLLVWVLFVPLVYKGNSS